MLAEIALWLIAGLVVFWALLDPVSRVANAAWEILLPIFDSKPVDLRSEFGEWAGELIVDSLRCGTFCFDFGWMRCVAWTVESWRSGFEWYGLWVILLNLQVTGKAFGNV